MKPLCALLLGTALALPAHPAPSLVVLVRHAEKDAGSNPGLSPAGQQRAEALAGALAQAGIRHILTSDQRRTQATAAPLAARQGLKAEALGFGPGGLAGHVKSLVDRIQAQDGAVLVVGHSNTVPELIAALGAAKPLPPCEASFGHAWVLVPQPAGGPQLLHLRYGAPDPEPSGPDCV